MVLLGLDNLYALIGRLVATMPNLLLRKKDQSNPDLADGTLFPILAYFLVNSLVIGGYFSIKP
jgi:hypothetical protein